MYNGRFIKVKEQTLNDYVWEKVFLPSSLVVYPITDENKILLIEEYRPHEKKSSRLKFITGHIGKNEDILVSANRELQEEVGYKAQSLQQIYHHQSSGTLNSNFYMILAKDLIRSKIPNPDGEETILSIKEFDLDEVEDMIYSQKITWGLSCLGFLYLKKECLS